MNRVLNLVHHPENGDTKLIRNVCTHIPVYKMSSKKSGICTFTALRTSCLACLCPCYILCYFSTNKQISSVKEDTTELIYFSCGAATQRGSWPPRS